MTPSTYWECRSKPVRIFRLVKSGVLFKAGLLWQVFHGAESDIEWLQRDFGLYVVNMFDTGQAARVLNLARYSLAHLLQVYCQVEADKQFQLSDWRIRSVHTHSFSSHLPLGLLSVYCRGGLVYLTLHCHCQNTVFIVKGGLVYLTLHCNCQNTVYCKGWWWW